MTNNNIYFVANWKMYGNLTSLNALNKVINISRSKFFKKAKFIYCPPFTLLDQFVKKTRNTKIDVGAQDCHFVNGSGPYTGMISANQIKKLGTKYIILGHSEKRSDGDTNQIINKKILISIKEKLKVILCVGETLKERSFDVIFENGLPKLSEVQSEEEVIKWNKNSLKIELKNKTKIGEDNLILFFSITKKADLLVNCFNMKDEFLGEYNLGNIF